MYKNTKKELISFISGKNRRSTMFVCHPIPLFISWLPPHLLCLFMRDYPTQLRRNEVEYVVIRALRQTCSCYGWWFFLRWTTSTLTQCHGVWCFACYLLAIYSVSFFNLFQVYSQNNELILICSFSMVM